MDKSENEKKIETLHGLETIELEHLLWLSIFQYEHFIKRAFSRELKEYGLSKERFAIVHELLCLGGESTPHALSRRVIFEPNSVSAILSRMEKEGLVSKTKDLDKKHMVRVKLTEKAIKLYPAALKASQETLKRYMFGISREEKIKLIELLSKLRDYSLPMVFKNKKTLTPFRYM